jgi:hypothetical protein
MSSTIIHQDDALSKCKSKALALVAQGLVSPNELESQYYVQSQGGNGTYIARVRRVTGGAALLPKVGAAIEHLGKMGAEPTTRNGNGAGRNSKAGAGGNGNGDKPKYCGGPRPGEPQRAGEPILCPEPGR